MNSKLRKRRKKHYIKIMSMFLGVFFVVAGAYAVMTYNHTHDNLFASAYDRVSQYYTVLLQHPDSLAYEVNSLDDNSTEARVYVREASGVSSDSGNSVSDNESETILAETGDYLAVSYSDDTFGIDSAIGVISYDELRGSMTNKQYNKITEYLQSKPDKTELGDGARYELVCRSFYFDGNNIRPTEVEIVVTSDASDWYAQDESVESFKLKPDVVKTENKIKYFSGEQHRNEIDTDFILNGYQSRHLLDYIDDLNLQGEDFPLELNTAPFTHIYCNSLSVDSIDKYVDTTYYLDFAREYNVLGECYVNILIASAIIFAFFAFVGIIVSRLSWKAIRTEIEQENIRRDMTKAMAHDLKTPLFIISGYAESLRENINADKRGYYADVIVEQTVRMDELVHSMLDFSRFDESDFELNRESFSLSELVRSAVEKYPDSRLELKCGDDCGVNADRNLLTTVIDNFIDNAVKYGTDAPIEITVENDRLSVTNGIAKEIPKAELEKVWEPYTKLDTSRYSKGNGLGLAIAKRILKMHGFSYGVETSDGKIKFWILFK